MTSRIPSFLILASTALTLGACSTVKEITGQAKRSPDEFAVYSRAPLTLPPNYTLRPPTPGSEAARTDDPALRAREAMLGAGAGGASSQPKHQPAAPVPVTVPASPGLQVLLRETGALNIDPEIRSKINRETSIMADEDRSFTERMMFWSAPADRSTVVNPGEEAKRIQANKALGRPITEGDVPTIKREEKGLLEGLF